MLHGRYLKMILHLKNHTFDLQMTVIVDYFVVGNADKPGIKFAPGLKIFRRFQRAEKRFLNNIFGGGAIFPDTMVNQGKKTVEIRIKNNFGGAGVTRDEPEGEISFIYPISIRPNWPGW